MGVQSRPSSARSINSRKGFSGQQKTSSVQDSITYSQDNQPKPEPDSQATTTADQQQPETQQDLGAIEDVLEPSNIKPLTYIRPSMIKAQTVRTNLDRFRIEQIVLRRLRYVIENNQAETDHLTMVEILEQRYIFQTFLLLNLTAKFKKIDVL